MGSVALEKREKVTYCMHKKESVVNINVEPTCKVWIIINKKERNK